MELRTRFGAGPPPEKWVAYCDKDGLQHGPYRQLIFDRERGDEVVSGSYLSGEKHGTWQTVRAGTTIRTQQYQSGVLHGRSVTPEGEGGYHEGKRQGLWKERDQGRTSEGGFVNAEGHYLDGEKHGRWTRFHAAGKKSAEGLYENGRRKGEWTEWARGGELTTRGSYKDDAEEGEWQLFDPKGEPLVAIVYANGEPVAFQNVEIDRSAEERLTRLVLQADNKPGRHYEWREDGTLRLTGHYQGDARQGVWTELRQDGTKAREQSYEAGELNGPSTTWHENSDVKSAEGNHKAGLRDGLWREWHQSGELWLEGSYKAGKREGLLTEYHPDGSKWEQGNYVAGKKTGRWVTWDKAGAVIKTEDL